MSTETGEDPGAEPVYAYLRRSAIEHEAVSRLRDLEYRVIRTDGRQPGVNLIGMKGNRFRFVCIRRRKNPAGPIAEVAATYVEDLYELRRYISPIVSIDLWIWSRPDGWRYFAVFPGGIQEIRGDDGHRL
ncbi:hypothetical protein [Methanosphaerula subterraneus]|uniref:hypothetical protein n=1 Tax=Methanosphaerula subterraneus TaxID=3350244 RepID=UPI003F844000